MTNTGISPFATVVVSTETQLRDAVNSANTGDIIQVNGTIVLTSQLIVPAGQDITITGLGAGAAIVRDLAGPTADGRVLTNNGSLTLENILITGGHTFSYDPAAASGGGIYNIGTLTLGQGAVVSNNTAESSGASLTGYGGGIYNDRATVFVNGNAIVADNTSKFGGGIYSLGGSTTLNGDAAISNNTALSSGGGISNSLDGTLILNDNATIFHNDAGGGVGDGGGGIYNGSTLIMNDNSSVTDNTTNNDGGGILNWGSSSLIRATATLNGNAVVSNNEALLGGGIYSHNNAGLGADVVLNDRSSVSYNISNSDGGGIYTTLSSSTVTLNDNSNVTDNSAPNGSGGGIWVLYQQLADVNAGPDVTFANNSASQAYEIAPGDIPLHNAHILTHTFTQPFEYGYNNYDIAYTRGTPRDVVTVSYDSNGGSAIDSQSVFAGDPTAEPPTPTLPGFEFAGWFIDPGLTVPWNFSDPVDDDMTLYAKWEQELPGAFNVSFVSNGGTLVPSQEVNAGDPLIPPQDPARNCDIFAGWYIDPELTVPWDFADPVEDDMTLYARWISRDCPEPPQPCVLQPPCACVPQPPCPCVLQPCAPPLCEPQYRPQCYCYSQSLVASCDPKYLYYCQAR
jgi:uncharacterized repeat protein (TIGR02543 family)